MREGLSSLDLGANDYITKPFGTAELLARIRASLRIARHHVQAIAPDGLFVLDDLSIDYDRRQVSVANIRKKLGCCPGKNKYIINELSVGYSMPDARE